MRVVASDRRVQLAAGAVVAAAIAVAACTGGGTHHGASSSSSGAAAQEPTRWWSNDVADVGSRIDPADPAAVANHLSVSAASYCSMLKSTVAAGRSLFTGAHAGDTALVTSTEAFVAEIEHVAPASVADDWRTLQPTLLALVEGKPLPSNTSTQAKANAAAAKRIGDDAQQNCGVKLSS